MNVRPTSFAAAANRCAEVVAFVPLISGNPNGGLPNPMSEPDFGETPAVAAQLLGCGHSEAARDTRARSAMNTFT